MGVDSHGDADDTRQAEVRQLDHVVLDVDEQILWLQVSVQDSALVAERDPLAYLNM